MGLRKWVWRAGLLRIFVVFLVVLPCLCTRSGGGLTSSLDKVASLADEREDFEAVSPEPAIGCDRFDDVGCGEGPQYEVNNHPRGLSTKTKTKSGGNDSSIGSSALDSVRDNSGHASPLISRPAPTSAESNVTKQIGRALYPPESGSPSSSPPLSASASFDNPSTPPPLSTDVSFGNPSTPPPPLQASDIPVIPSVSASLLPTAGRPSVSAPLLPTAGRTQSHTVVVVVSSVLALVIGCGIIGACLFFIVRPGRKRDLESNTKTNSFHERAGFLRRPTIRNIGSLKYFTFREIEVGTDKFNSVSLGKGPFGIAYEGVFEGLKTVVKFRAKGSTAILSDFRRDVVRISGLTHKNLVRLIGFCDEKDYQALVLEYFPNGSLEDRSIHGKNGTLPLDWQTRLTVLIGAATGIEFIHMRKSGPSVHCHVKSSNVLIDDQFEGKLGDVGNFRTQLFDDKTHSYLSLYFSGYLDPYYLTDAETLELDRKSDVYSFGVVLLECLSGQKAMCEVGDGKHVTLTEWVADLWRQEDVRLIVDPRLQEGTYSIETIRGLLDTALLCVSTDPSLRPTIKQVRQKLEDAAKMSLPEDTSAAATEVISVEIQTAGAQQNLDSTGP